MAKNWYPVVVNTEGCIEGCRGCGNLCPNGAIQYIGDNSGWTPPNGVPNSEKKDDNSCCCGGNC